MSRAWLALISCLAACRGGCEQPRCADCAPVNRTIYECWHIKAGDPCSGAFCIENVLATASCKVYPDRKGDPDCDTAVARGPELNQFTYETDNCQAEEETTRWHDLDPIIHGCGTECITDKPWKYACKTKPCGGTRVWGPSPRGERKKCGCGSGLD
jgi:hypothetical protein